MNIGIVVDNTYYNDIRVRREVDVLRSYFKNVYVLCFDFGNNNDKNREDHVFTIKIKRKYKDFLFLLQNRLPLYELFWSRHITRFIKRLKLDVIHTHDLYMSNAAKKSIKLSGRDCKLVLDLHENYPEVVKSYSWTKGIIRKNLAYPGLWKKKESRYLENADRMIVLSEAYKKELLAKYSQLDPDAIIVFPNVPDLKSLQSFETNDVLTDKEIAHPVFFYFGVIGQRRGILQSIRVFERYLSKGYEGTLLLIGPVDKYDRNDFFNAINKDTVAKHITYIPWIELKQLPSYLKISDVCLAPFVKNPQHESGISNKIYQYMFGRKPIISSNCKPQQNLIEKCKFGLIFSNDEEYFNAMIKLGNDKKLQEEFGKNAYNALIEENNIEHYKDVIIGLYKGLGK